MRLCGDDAAAGRLARAAQPPSRLLASEQQRVRKQRQHSDTDDEGDAPLVPALDVPQTALHPRRLRHRSCERLPAQRASDEEERGGDQVEHRHRDDVREAHPRAGDGGGDVHAEPGDGDGADKQLDGGGVGLCVGLGGEHAREEAAHHGKDDERDPDQQREEEPAEGGVVAVDVVVRGGRVERLAAQPALPVRLDRPTPQVEPLLVPPGAQPRRRWGKHRHPQRKVGQAQRGGDGDTPAQAAHVRWSGRAGDEAAPDDKGGGGDRVKAELQRCEWVDARRQRAGDGGEQHRQRDAQPPDHHHVRFRPSMRV
mmetsp:Transcript_23326/g.75208  ORF Transcript_23326/g.75208 Transcript_23326/m.75208 type:complete len:311 (-) Transcript_23326:328-1260(-)